MSAQETAKCPKENPRRMFLFRIFELGFFAGIGGFLARNLILYVLPPIKEAVKRKVYVSPLSRIPAGELYETQDLQGRPVALLRSVASGSGSGSSGAAAASADGSAIMAFSTRCTHLGCQVRWQPTEQTFLCPCHMGVFDKTGKVISGPPPAPLAQYEVVVENDNVFLKFPEA